MNILFVCQGNINRSQMAAAFFRQLMPEAEVLSAGVHADASGKTLAEIPGGSVGVMQELDIDISNVRVTQLTESLVEWADKIVLMGEIPRGGIPAYLTGSSKLIQWHVPDPGYGRIALGDARDSIKQLVLELVEQLKRSSVH